MSMAMLARIAELERELERMHREYSERFDALEKLLKQPEQQKNTLTLKAAKNG